MSYDQDVWREPRRARRIRNKLRMQKRGQRVAAYFFPDPQSLPGRDAIWADVFERRRMYGVVHGDYLAACSCCGCGNQRRHFKTLTMQERRARDSADGAMDESALPDLR
jgi:hypothetical protein